MECGPEIEDYIKKHRINELFSEILSSLLFHRPDNPFGFMKQLVEKHIRHRQDGEFYHFFSISDIEAIIRSLDPASSGFVTFDQYKNTLELVGSKYPKITNPEKDVSVMVLKDEILDFLKI